MSKSFFDNIIPTKNTLKHGGKIIMRKILSIILVVLIMTMSLTACGSNDIEPTTEPTTETSTEHSETYESFIDSLNKFWNESDATLSKFAEEPIISDEFLAKMEELNADCANVEDIYYSVAFNLEETTDVSLAEYERMDYYNLYVLHDPMLKLDYDDIWDDYNNYSHMDYDSDIGWYYTYSIRYANGVFEISDEIAISELWFHNMELLTVTHSPDGLDGYGYRTFKIIDPTQDAYILLDYMESPDQLVRIMPIEEK